MKGPCHVSQRRYTIADHLVFEIALIAVFYQLVEACDELLCRLSLSLASRVKLCSLKSNILAHFKKCVEFLDDGIVILLLVIRDVCR